MSVPVLHFRGRFLPLTETFIFRQIEGLNERGAFTPYALCYDLDTSNPLPAERCFAIRGAAPPPPRLQAPSRPASLISKIKEPLYELDRRRRRFGMIRRDWPITPAAREWLAGVRPRLLHAHFGQDGVGVAHLASELNIPLVVTFYGQDISVLPRSPLWRAHYRRMFAQAAAVLAEGSTMLNRLKAIGLPESKARLIRNPSPVDQIEFRARRRPDPASEPVRMVFVGRFVEKKGLTYALRALAALRPEFPSLSLDVIGGGELDAPLREEAARLGLLRAGMGNSPAAVFHGPLPYPQMAEIMRRADFAIAPSLTAADGDSEGGAPNILLDAQAMGLPIIATTHCDIPEFVLPNRSALLAPEADAPALANQIRALLTDPAFSDWTAMGHAGRDHVQREFATPAVISALESLYRELI